MRYPERLKLRPTRLFAVTGTFHGSLITAVTEGDARRIFHKYHNGESIIHIKKFPLTVKIENL